MGEWKIAVTLRMRGDPRMAKGRNKREQSLKMHVSATSDPSTALARNGKDPEFPGCSVPLLNECNRLISSIAFTQRMN
jgi:hypothetical protein